MSLDKAIRSGKEKRKPYRKAAAVDGHCANHNPKKGQQCPWCVANRLYANKKREEQSQTRKDL